MDREGPPRPDSGSDAVVKLDYRCTVRPAAATMIVAAEHNIWPPVGRRPRFITHNMLMIETEYTSPLPQYNTSIIAFTIPIYM